MRRLFMPIVLLAFVVACHPLSDGLPREYARRFAAEGIVREARRQVFRYTYFSQASQRPRWEERDASIIITKRSVFIHKLDKVGLDLTVTSRKVMEVRRNGDRVIVGSGSGQSKVTWSFRPAEDAGGWVTSILAVIDPQPEADPYLDP